MQQFVPTRHGKIWTHQLSCQNARGLVLSVSGSGEYRTVDTWSTRRLAQWLNSHRYSLLAFDKWGCGESEGSWKSVTLDILAEVAIDLAAHAKKNFDSRLLYLGQSEGSKIAFELAAQSNEAIAYALRVPSHQPIKERLRYQILEMNKDAEAWDAWQRGITEIEKQLAATQKIEGFLYDHPRSYWASCLDRTQPADLLPKIKAPVFVLNGGADPFTPKIAYETLHLRMNEAQHPQSCARVYEGVGHSLTPDGKKWQETEAASNIISWFNERCPG